MLGRSSIKSSPEPFWHSVNILLTKPHVINKRLWGCKIMKRSNCKPKTSNWKAPLVLKNLDYVITNDNIYKCAKEFQEEAKLVFCGEEEITSRIEIILAEQLPKTYSGCQLVQVVIIDRENYTVTFYDVSQKKFNQKFFPDFTYALELSENEVKLNANTGLLINYYYS